jgi:RNA polymerase sigma factor (sigma-70 family)
MTPSESAQCLGEYVRSGSQDSFARIVHAHVDLVYAAALRQVRDPHMAEDVTQAVFIVLARKAPSLSAGTILAGWLIRTARFCAKDALKQRRRQLLREREAAAMKSNSIQPSAASELYLKEMLPHLDHALSKLSDKDRAAVALRFLEQRSLRDVSLALGTSEEAAKKRVARAVEKLRAGFSHTTAPSELNAVVSALAAYSNPQTPDTLASRVVGAASSKSFSATSLKIAEGAIRTMRRTPFKIAAVLGGTAVIIASLIWILM